MYHYTYDKVIENLEELCTFIHNEMLQGERNDKYMNRSTLNQIREVSNMLEDALTKLNKVVPF